MRILALGLNQALSSKAVECGAYGRSSDLFLRQAAFPVVDQWRVDGLCLMWNSQQRDCLGFSPNSLLISIPRRGISNLYGRKDRNILPDYCMAGKKF